MIAFLTGLHILICVGLIVVVLLQSSRGTGLASVFGGGGGGSLVGGKGFGSILAKATAFLAIGFMLTAIGLTLMPRGRKATLEGIGGTGEIPVEEGARPAQPGSAPQEIPAGE